MPIIPGVEKRLQRLMEAEQASGNPYFDAIMVGALLCHVDDETLLACIRTAVRRQIVQTANC